MPARQAATTAKLATAAVALPQPPCCCLRRRRATNATNTALLPSFGACCKSNKTTKARQYSNLRKCYPLPET